MPASPDALVRMLEVQYGPFVHMAPMDKAIWCRYLLQGGRQFAPFTYDVRVGNGVDMGSDSTAIARAAAYALTTKRIDVICLVNGNVRIIEVKQRAGLSAIGQLIGYQTLYTADHPNQGNPEMWLITDVLQPDMTAPLTTSNIIAVEVGF